MPSTHAKLSCSGSERWINCPGSVKLSENFPNKSSIYANEGTLAHDLGETLISTGSIPEKKLEIIRKFYADHSELNYTVEKMIADVKRYSNYVMRKFNMNKDIDQDTTLMIEQQVSLDKWIPNGFGTSDIIIVTNGKLRVIDFKFGKNAKVSAKNNPQLRLYALGALNKLDDKFNIDEVTMTIYQPRVRHISNDYITAKDLYSWGDNIIKPAAELTTQDKAPLKAGHWCKFCPAKYICDTFDPVYL